MSVTVLLLMPTAKKRGGAEEALDRLLRHSSSAHTEWVVAFFEEGPFCRSLTQRGVTTRVLDAGRLRQVHKYVRTVRHIARLAQEVDADLVFSWMPKAHLYGSWAATLAGLPSAWYQFGVPEFGWMERIITLQPAQAIVACSRHTADMQSDLWPRRPTYTVPPCVDLDRFDPDSLPSPTEARRELGLPVDGPLVGIVGRLQRWKGIHTFVDALPRILDSHPDAYGVIVGGRHSLEPEYDAHIDRRIADRGLQDRIFKVGYQSNVPRWMQAMDIVVHASQAEPFGMVIVEAMALGKPVVAGATGGPQEIITDGENGVFAPFEDPRALAHQVTHLLAHPDEARRMGRAARERAQEFSAQDFADELTSTLRSLVDALPA